MQFSLSFKKPQIELLSYRDRFHQLLQSDLNFHGNNSTYSSHAIHAFPAKFPPQLPKIFIENLTQPNDIVLDPMIGSRTTVLEAFLHGRKVIGFDIDPLAILIGRVKTGLFNKSELNIAGKRILQEAEKNIRLYPEILLNEKAKRFSEKTVEFINYWFTEEVQMELLALLIEIEKIESEKIKDY